jgi:Core-2/I-Branching enzyme
VTIAYVVSAYKLPDQLVRLVDRLDAPDSWFAVHVDARAPSAVFDPVATELGKRTNVELLARHPSYWGGFGHVRTSLKGMERAFRAQIQFDYLVLLTGQDYPLRPPAGIAAFFERAAGRSYMSHWPLPHAGWEGRGGLDRLERYHVVRGRRLRISLPLRRRLPGGLVPFGGGPYWCLSRAAAEYVHTVVREQPELVRFFEHVFVPDELFFQTILLNSEHVDSIVDDSLRYLDWTREPAPAILGVNDLPELLASKKLFARKFDSSVDADVLDVLDEHLDHERVRA